MDETFQSYLRAIYTGQNDSVVGYQILKFTTFLAHF